MNRTTFEKLKQLISKNRSTDGILYYFENKEWFEKYKLGTMEAYYQIPYDVWVRQTFIHRAFIKKLSDYIFPGQGTIYYSSSDMVIITGSEEPPFESRTPQEHILRLCKKHKNTRVLINYLDEFYCRTFQNERVSDSFVRYTIYYDHWYEIFKMPLEDIRMMSRCIQSGYIRIIEEPDKIAIIEITL